MESNQNIHSRDRMLSLKAWWLGIFGSNESYISALRQVLEVRRLRFAPDHASMGDIYEALAFALVDSGNEAGLQEADTRAQQAERIVTLTGKKGRNSVRVARLVHLRCRIHQTLGLPYDALDLGEEALMLYNKSNKLLDHGRSSVMHTLIHLHRQVGSEERAKSLAIEVAALDGTLMRMSARHRF